MTLRISSIIFTLITIFAFVSNNDTKEKERGISSAIHSELPDSLLLKVSTNEEDIIFSSYLENRLEPIRENFKRINSKSHWTSIKKKELFQSTEGGEATFYFSDNGLEKIIARQFGEGGQNLTEYYLLNGALSFVFDKSISYNRPIYYDSLAMIENNDNQYFDLKMSEFVEERFYFERGKLIHIINDLDCGAPMEEGFLKKEEQRVAAKFDLILKSLNDN